MSEVNPDAAQRPLSFEYVLTFADYNTMAHHAQGRFSLWVSKWVFWPLVVINAASGTFLLYVTISDGEPVGWASLFGLGVVAVMIVGRYLIVPMLRKWHFNQTRLGGRDTRVTLGDEKISISARGLSSAIAVTEVLRLQELPTHFLFWINVRQAIIIPKRALNGPGDADSIRNYAQDAGLEIT